MDFSISGMFKNIGAYFGRMSKGKRLTLLGVAGLLIVGSIALARYLNDASYIMLYRGLSPSEGAQVVQILDGAGVDYRLQSDGSILVPKEDEARLKMQLAANGLPNSTLGYDLFSGQSDLMSTDYEKKQFLIFQLQDRLQAALKTLTGVKDAIVTLNVADESAYVLKSEVPESSASVVLHLYGYADIGQRQIKGIEALVTKSVPGLKAMNVTIVDGEGNVLNDQSHDLGAGQTDAQIEAIDKVNKAYEDKITRFLEPVFGVDNVSVSVSAQLSFDKKTTEQTTYTPVVGQTGIIARQQSDRTSTNGGVVVGGVAGTEANVGVPTYPEREGDEDKDTSATERVSTDFLINQVIESALDNGGKILDMTVSLMINGKDVAQEVLTKYRDMVAYSVGIPPEKVFVTNAEFLKKPEPPSAPAVIEETPVYVLGLLPLTVSQLILYGGIGLFGLILLLILLALLRRGRKKKKPENAERQGLEAIQKGVQPSTANIPDEIVLSETREQGLKRQVREFTAANPEVVATLIRGWMKEDGK
ncbi:flagellar basal-body MS-ring/collar protein FliF [Bacillota bacterium Meth-B3]